MRRAPAFAVFKACLFAIIWMAVIALLPKGDDMPWLSLLYGILAIFLPIIVAVDLGYQAADRATAAPFEDDDLVSDRASARSDSDPITAMHRLPGDARRP